MPSRDASGSGDAARSPADEPTVGLPPVADPSIHTLILGSLPSRRSLQLGQYYGHPRNAFWHIMGELFGASRELGYADRKARLLSAGIGLWDVLHSSLRPGSMDADIADATAQPNDFAAFFAAHPRVDRVCFNGRKAAELFRRRVAPPAERGLRYLELPSTSPAHAAMPYGTKLERWSAVRDR